MSVRFLLALTACAAVVQNVDGATVDNTRTPGTSGSDVVNAVVSLLKSRCIFSQDRQFLRRLAYLESKDGTDPDTYAQGYNGGIWKVREVMFNATNNCASILHTACDLIEREFNITWTQVDWSDLRKPLYSALGAVLYLMQRRGTVDVSIPATESAQENLWEHYYHFGAAVRNFSESNAVLNYDCGDEMDLLFILDGSGSIDNPSFNLSLDFVANVVQAMNVSSHVQVAVIVFSSSARVQFYFNTYSSKSAILSAIRGITRVSGSTNTAAALNLARNSVFSTANGARSDGTAKRVAVLVTDGNSDNNVMTSAAAENLREDTGVAVFAIGVGGYNLVELRAVASEPVCDHVYTLASFADIGSIVTEIQRSTCAAHRVLSSNVTATTGTKDTTITIPPPSDNTTSVKVEVTCGTASIYVSYTNPNPNPALYSDKYTATDDHPVYIVTTTANNGLPIYMTVIGTKLPPSAALLRNCTEFQYLVSVVEHTELVCCEGSDCKPCTPQQFREYPGIRDIVCTNNNQQFTNPCTVAAIQEGRLLFPYPYGDSKFIRCDLKGQAYVTQCPNGVTFNPTSLTCGYNNVGPNTREPLPSNYPNPCTPAHIQAEYFFFEYTRDRNMYIHCDLFGLAWLQRCPVLKIWDQAILTCVPDQPLVTTKAPSVVANPCTPDALAAGKFFHPYPCDHTRFIHCDIAGNMWVQACPVGMFFNPDTFLCTVGDPQHTPPC